MTAALLVDGNAIYLLPQKKGEWKGQKLSMKPALHRERITASF